MNGDKRNLTKEEKWLDGQSLKDFGLGFKAKIQDFTKNSIDTAVSNLDGKGLILNELKKLDIVSETEGIIINEDSIKLNVVDDLVTGGVNRPLSAEQGKILKQLIDTLGSGGASKLLRNAKALGELDYIGSLAPNSKSIAVGQRLYNPKLYLDGTRIDKNSYSVELETGLITLNEIYADYDVTWVVEDKFPYHIKFSYPTLNLLINDTEMKKNIALGDVIEIQGESDADDGGHRLVKCEDSSKLNGVDIGEGRFLNEIPNTRGANKLDKGTYSGTAQDLKDEIDNKLDKNGGTVNGILNVENYNNSAIKLLRDGENWSEYYTSNLNGGYVGLVNAKSLKYIKMFNNGNTTIDANNLDTNSKEVIGAINELNTDKLSSRGGVISGNVSFRLGESAYTCISMNTYGEKGHGSIGIDDDNVWLYNNKSGKSIRLYNNGHTSIHADNLKTYKKDVIESINEIYDKGLLPKNLDSFTFDGTFGDFYKNVKSGVYVISTNTSLTISNLGLPNKTYDWGRLVVEYDEGYGCRMTYISDYNRDIFSLYIFNFINQPELKLDESMWYEIYSSRSVQTWKSEDGTMGWVKYPDGRLEQWQIEVREDVQQNESKKIIFPTTFKGIPYVNVNVFGLDYTMDGTQESYFVFAPKVNIKYYSWVARGYWK